MAIKHTTPADGTFSPAGAAAWDADLLLEASTVATQHLGGDITAAGVGVLTQATSTLIRVYIGAGVSDFSGAYADLSATTHTHAQYQAVSTLSSAAFQVTSHFAISSIVVAHVALSDPHTQYQRETGLSSAAFTLATDYALSTHAATHITGGNDAIPSFSDTASGLAPLSGTSTNLFLRGDGVWIGASGGVAWGSITGTLSDQTDLQDELDAKATSSIVIAHVALANPHTQYQMVSSLSSAAYTVTSHYSISSVVATHVALADPHTQYQLETGLSSAAYQVTSHFAISSIVVTHVALADPHTQYQLESGLSTGAFQVSSMYAVSTHALRHITGGADLIPNFSNTSTGLANSSAGGTTNFLRADGLWFTPDPWTYVKVSSAHFGTSTVAFVNIPGLNFIPGTNSTYEWEFMLLLKTSTAAVTPRVGVRWPTGTSSVGWINQGQTQSTQLFCWGNQISTMLTPPVGLLESTTAAWAAMGGGCICTFGATASSFGLMLATESTTVFVSTMMGGFLKYRTN